MDCSVLSQRWGYTAIMLAAVLASGQARAVTGLQKEKVEVINSTTWVDSKSKVGPTSPVILAGANGCMYVGKARLDKKRFRADIHVEHKECLNTGGEHTGTAMNGVVQDPSGANGLPVYCSQSITEALAGKACRVATLPEASSGYIVTR